MARRSYSAFNKRRSRKEVMKILDIYKNTVEEELAIPVITGKKSEKEKFVGAVYTRQLWNQ